MPEADIKTTMTDATGNGSGATPPAQPLAKKSTPDSAAFQAGFRRAMDREVPALVEKARREWLAEIGADDDAALDAIKQQLADTQRARPEQEKRERVRAKEIGDLKTAADGWQKKYEEQFDANRSLVLRSHALSIAQELDAFDPHDLFEFLDERVEHDDDGSRFVDGEEKIDLIADPEAWKKIRDHVAKTKPHWLRTRSIGGAGTGTGRPAPAPAPGPATDSAGLAQHFARDALSRGLSRR